MSGSTTWPPGQRLRQPDTYGAVSGENTPRIGSFGARHAQLGVVSAEPSLTATSVHVARLAQTVGLEAHVEKVAAPRIGGGV